MSLVTFTQRVEGEVPAPYSVTVSCPFGAVTFVGRNSGSLYSIVVACPFASVVEVGSPVLKS
jgi:hypothetical protein